jgi:hypothetical protein
MVTPAFDGVLAIEVKRYPERPTSVATFSLHRLESDDAGVA